MERKGDSVKKKVLGRGLSALLTPTVAPAGEKEAGLLQIPMGKIRAGGLQPRKTFPPETLAELVASIREKGVLVPLTVRPTPDGYELVAGERRFRAAEAAGLSAVPAVVRKLTDREALEVALVDNLQRSDLNPIEQVFAKLKTLLRKANERTVEDTWRRIGKLLDHFKAAGNITEGYSILFAICAFAYLVSFAIHHVLAPRFESLSQLSQRVARRTSNSVRPPRIAAARP